jgi:hypothetical protein
MPKGRKTSHILQQFSHSLDQILPIRQTQHLTWRKDTNVKSPISDRSFDIDGMLYLN